MSVLRHLPHQTVLADRAEVAASFTRRLKGLIGRQEFAEGEALCIPGCNMVHMFWMSIPIDVVFTAADGTVLGVHEELRPWRLSRFVAGATCAIELPVGSVARHQVCVGDRIVVEES